MNHMNSNFKMKSDRNIHQYTRRSARVRPSVFAMLAISFAASAVLGARASALKTLTAQTKDTNGTVTGTLTVDGKEIKLKHVYAQERDFRPPAPGGAIDLFITNLPLADDILSRISENRYHGSDKIRGIRLTIRPWKLDQGPEGGKYQSWDMGIGIGGDRGEPVVSRVLDQSGPVSDNNRQNRWLKDFKIENGRVRGKAEYRGEDGIRTTTYSVSFDAPLGPKSFETKSIKTATGGEQFPKDFQSFMLGKWSIERWRQENGLSHTGILSVEERLGEEKLRGVFHIVVGGDGRKVEEEVTITRKGTTIRMEGRVISGTGWLADNLTFELKNNLLVGGPTEETANFSDLVLRKIQ